MLNTQTDVLCLQIYIMNIKKNIFTENICVHITTGIPTTRRCTVHECVAVWQCYLHVLAALLSVFVQSTVEPI